MLEIFIFPFLKICVISLLDLLIYLWVLLLGQGERVIRMTYHYWLLTFVKHNVYKTINVYDWVVAVGSSEMFVSFYQTAQPHLPEDNGPHVDIMNSADSVAYLKLIMYTLLRLWASGLWCIVAWQINTNTVEESSASIFRIEEEKIISV
jgi:hypothetical protein